MDLSAKEFLYALARLGGHLGRKGDRPPGWLVLWRGWMELQPLVEGMMMGPGGYGESVRCSVAYGCHGRRGRPGLRIMGPGTPGWEAERTMGADGGYRPGARVAAAVWSSTKTEKWLPGEGSTMPSKSSVQRLVCESKLTRGAA